MFKKLLSLLFVAAILTGVGTSKVAADDAYTYTVTFDTGLYGVEVIDRTDGKNTPVTAPLVYRADDALNLGDFRVFDLNNNKYYFIGWHLYGQMDEYDSGEGKPQGTFKAADISAVDRDLILVATYGIKGDMCEYHVHYVNTIGEELLPMDVFYGKAGEPAVAYFRYVSGYIPDKQSVSGTITKEKPLDLTFVYSKYELTEYEIDEGEEYITTYPTRVTERREPEVVEETIEEIEYVEPEPAPAPAPAPEPAPEPEPEKPKTIFETISDAFVPLINFVNDTIDKNPVLGYSLVALMVLFAILFFALLAFLIFFLIKRRKKNNDEGPKSQMA